jgi:hypothetical protein
MEEGDVPTRSCWVQWTGVAAFFLLLAFSWKRGVKPHLAVATNVSLVNLELQSVHKAQSARF